MKGRLLFAMAHGQPIPRVWQPWYIEEDRLKAMRCSPAKDLPTRTSKQKRLKDRRELDYVTLNARHRHCNETLLRTTSSSPHLENSAARTDTDSVSDSSEEHEEIDDGDEDEEDHQVMVTVDDDSPLDMTTPNRSRAASPPSSPKSIHVPTTRIYNPAPSYNGSHLQAHAQQRPSVITCAAALNHHPPHHHHRHQGHQQHHQHHHGHMVSLLRGAAAGNSNAANKSDVRTGTRSEVASGMCDPVIDEHFRRSLGKDYPEFLSSAAPPLNTNPSTNTSISITGMSVDDHFAKALGDTWLRLQAGKQSDVALPTPPTSGTAKSISASSPTTLGLQQRPGVVST